MRMLYTLDVYCNALIQMLIDCLRRVGIHVVWIRLIVLLGVLYLFAASLVAARVQIDTSLLIFLSLGVSAMFMLLMSVVYDASHVFFGNAEHVDREREGVVNALYASGITVLRPILTGALLCFVVTIPELGLAARLFVYSATCFIALLYLETCS